jgi:hypothetical protein
MVGRMGSAVEQPDTVVGWEMGKHHFVIVDAEVFEAAVVKAQRTGNVAEGLLILERSWSVAVEETDTSFEVVVVAENVE